MKTRKEKLTFKNWLPSSQLFSTPINKYPTCQTVIGSFSWHCPIHTHQPRRSIYKAKILKSTLIQTISIDASFKISNACRKNPKPFSSSLRTDILAHRSVRYIFLTLAEFIFSSRFKCMQLLNPNCNSVSNYAASCVSVYEAFD